MQFILIVLLLLILVVGIVGVVLLTKIYAAKKKELPEAEPGAQPESKAKFPVKPTLGYIGGLLVLFFLTLATRNSFFALFLLIAGVLGPVLLVAHFVRRNKAPVEPGSALQEEPKAKLSRIQLAAGILLFCFLCFVFCMNFSAEFRLIVAAGITATGFLVYSLRSRKKQRTSIRVFLWAVIAGVSGVVLFVLVQNTGFYQRSQHPGTNYAMNQQNRGDMVCTKNGQVVAAGCTGCVCSQLGDTVCTRNGQVVASIQGGNVTTFGNGISVITVNGKTTITSNDGAAVNCTQNGNVAGGQDLGTLDLATVQSKASSGDAVAQDELGIRYESGVGGAARDYAQAMFWFQKSAAQGNGDAKNGIGWMYLNGLGIKKDYAQAMFWFQLSAAQGNASGENNIGWTYFNGWGVKKNYTQAMYWFQKAAAQGLPDAENNIGNLYFAGQGVRADNAQARAWYEKAAAQGNQYAKQSLAQMNAQAQPAPAPTPAPQQTYATQPAPAPQQTASSDSSQPAADYQHCAIVTEKTVNLNGMNDNTLVQLGNSCNFAIDTVAVSTSHRVLNGRAANDPGGGIGWSTTANGDPFIYVCPDPLEPVDENGNLPTAPNQTIYCKQVTFTGRQEY